MSPLRWIRKKLSPPGPKELGLSERNALGLRKFTPFQKGFMWEDWDEIVKRDYPVRYFITEVVFAYLSRLLYRCRRWCYKWESLLFKHEYKIDLRDADPLHGYEYGYVSPQEIIERACWKALMMHVETHLENPHTRGYSDEEKQEQWFLDEVERYDEFQTLYTYWTVTRGEDEAASTALMRRMDAAVADNDEERYRELQTQFLNNNKAEDAKNQEMLERVVKLCPFMW